MKRFGGLFEKIVSHDNLIEAIRHACIPNGRTSPSKKRAIKDAKQNPELYAAKIKELMTGDYRTSSYNRYPLFDPKLRFIYSLPFFPDRIVHHALLIVLEPLWDARMMATSYACRKGKGQHQAGTLCAQYARQYKYVAQFDIAQFYVSINHEILKSVLRRKIKDKRLLAILDEIVDSISTRDENLRLLYRMKKQPNPHKDVDREIKKLETSKARDGGQRAGLPIGSYTSQWFGNLYMNELDDYLKHELKAKAVIRYCDDFVVFSNDKKYLHEVKDKVRSFLWDHLQLMLSKAEVFPTAQGVDFCGYRYFPQGYVLLRKRTVNRQRQRLKQVMRDFRSGKMPPETARSVIASLDGWMRWAKSYNLRRKIGFHEMQKEVLDAC